MSSEPAGPRPWVPGAGWARLRRELPHLVPELTDDDLRKADELSAEADRRRDEGRPHL
ncbi:hypothetical protein [Dactylosporangium sp. NPDC051541]|uniref:hypothetical protein n=1 Tax=Dactylosporangium sp. NPDC051541 TaxID=3363977 RepID=UPI0037A6E36D